MKIRKEREFTFSETFSLPSPFAVLKVPDASQRTAEYFTGRLTIL